MKNLLLQKEQTGIVLIDPQEKLMSVMGQKDATLNNMVKLLHLAKRFELPVLLTEQMPENIGKTVDEIKSLLPDLKPVEKVEFDCCAVSEFNHKLEALALKTIILSGIESHVCVFQSCLSLLERGYRVFVLRDAVDSRTEENRQNGLELMREAGAVITSTETVIFQFLKKAGSDDFKAMLKVIK